MRFVRTEVGWYAAPVSDLSDQGGVSCFCVGKGRGEADITPSSAEGVVVVAILSSEELEAQLNICMELHITGALSFPTVDSHTHTNRDTNTHVLGYSHAD